MVIGVSAAAIKHANNGHLQLALHYILRRETQTILSDSCDTQQKRSYQARSRMTGYFAFPPTSDDSFARPTHERVPFSNIQERQPDASTAPTLDDVKLDEEKKAQKELAAQKRVAQEEMHQKRVEYEQREIWLSELAWVRSGGILRDENYSPDKVRTEMARAENRLQDEERAIQKKWDDYDAQWRALVLVAVKKEHMSWQDVPWPVQDKPMSPDDITPDAVAAFLFATYTIRGSTRNEKERIPTYVMMSTWKRKKRPSTSLEILASGEEYGDDEEEEEEGEGEEDGSALRK